MTDEEIEELLNDLYNTPEDEFDDLLEKKYGLTKEENYTLDDGEEIVFSKRHQRRMKRLFSMARRNERRKRFYEKIKKFFYNSN